MKVDTRIILVIVVILLIVTIIIAVNRYVHELYLDREIAGNLFAHLPDSTEIPERIVTNHVVSPYDNVLELGANRGGVSILLATILKDPLNQLVSVDPNPALIDVHANLMQKYNVQYNLFTGVVVADGINLECQVIGNDYSKCSLVNQATTTDNKTIHELEQHYNIKFNVLVIDCEGCYESLFEDWVSKGYLSQIRAVIIEWDSDVWLWNRFHKNNRYEKLLKDNGFVLVEARNHKWIWHGVRGYVKKNSIN